MPTDLKGSTPADWLVIGWFTPSYRPLAEMFAGNLAHHGAPYHLFAKPAGEGWSTRRKPSVVLEAMELYPNKTLVLCDVDCLARGDIEPVTQIGGADVGIVAIARDVPKRNGWRHWLAIECSSRVVVFRPTAGARLFAERWAAQIERSTVNHDEHSMCWAYLTSPDLAFSFIPAAYSGREVDQLADGVIVHASAHEKHRRRELGPVRQLLRAIERPFRTGKTSAGKLRGLGVLAAAGKREEAA